MKKVAAILAGLLALANGHSWVACTKYNKDITGQDYDNTYCLGYPRSWYSYVQYSTSDVFGVDHGANYQPSTGAMCPKTIGNATSNYSSTYTTAYPMASYKPGDTIRLVWPAKNHANYECYSNIPDSLMKLYVNNKTNPTSDPSVIGGWQLVIDWHAGGKSGDGVPFQNCPSFCTSTDKAVCYGDFTVPTLSTGFYTFMWYWGFNSATDLYTTCWEAYISSSASSSSITNSSDDNGGNSNSAKKTKYTVQIPVCYTGAAYDEDTVEDTATTLFGIDTSANDVTKGTSSFNTTLILITTASVANITSDADSTLCSALETAFGSGNCTICSDVTVSVTSSAYQIQIFGTIYALILLWIAKLF